MIHLYFILIFNLFHVYSMYLTLKIISFDFKFFINKSKEIRQEFKISIF